MYMLLALWSSMDVSNIVRLWRLVELWWAGEGRWGSHNSSDEEGAW